MARHSQASTRAHFWAQCQPPSCIEEESVSVSCQDRSGGSQPPSPSQQLQALVRCSKGRPVRRPRTGDAKTSGYPGLAASGPRSSSQPLPSAGVSRGHSGYRHRPRGWGSGRAQRPAAQLPCIAASAALVGLFLIAAPRFLWLQA